MTSSDDHHAHPEATSRGIRWARGYDLLLTLIWRRGERAYREQLISLARLEPGEIVLDIGCGTGTLAIAAKHRVGKHGIVSGIDVSSPMIDRARRKAGTAGVNLDLKVATAEALPFASATFNAVLITTVLHALPENARRQCLDEIHRVLRPGGRLLAVDFGGPEDQRQTLIGRHPPHRQFDLAKLLPVVEEAGLTPIETGAVGFSDLHFVLAETES